MRINVESVIMRKLSFRFFSRFSAIWSNAFMLSLYDISWI